MKFSKITKTQYFLDHLDKYIKYDDIKLPRRATKGSAGFDIFSVTDLELAPAESVLLPTGINVHVDNDKFLLIVPRSGIGFKFKVQLYNTCGIIDSDYCDSDNEGHIWLKLYNDSPDNKTLVIKQGDAICQGIICQYFVTDDDDVSETRNGGFGSTSK